MWRGRPTGAEPGDLVAFLTEERCAASDRADPFTARLSLPDGAVQTGCCRPQAAP